ncbi:hypothetical protein PIB30_075179 [Stylosanthes scabra]|uniref:Reverse transcriptase domain-containing protein n=1 Tax=Stylosanthes scabra TaxID=79078 RepID=A0ABU6QR37_9FABA|nr:hypothetical protein [Stylosanthes scabra]
MTTNSNGTPPTNVEFLALVNTLQAELVKLKKTKDGPINLTEGGGPTPEELTPSEGEPPKIKKGPFKDEIMKFTMSTNSTLPTTLKPYDGSGDPKIHVTKFENMMLINGSSDPTLCRLFPTFLGGVALLWFCSLPIGVGFHHSPRLGVTHNNPRLQAPKSRH